MKKYKQQLFKKLSESGWELLSDDKSEHWWLESSWKLKSIKQSFGLEIYILFFVDPHYEGNKKESAVHLVEAHKEMPSNRNDESYTLTETDVLVGNYEEKLIEFMDEINEYRVKSES